MGKIKIFAKRLVALTLVACVSALNLPEFVQNTADAAAPTEIAAGFYEKSDLLDLNSDAALSSSTPSFILVKIQIRTTNL